MVNSNELVNQRIEKTLDEKPRYPITMEHK